MISIKKATAGICIILSIALVCAGCGKKGAVGKDAEKDEAIPVRVMKVEPRDLSKALEYVGTIKGRDEAIVYPKVSGKICEKVKEDGSPVQKDEVIAYIDRDEVGLKFEKAPIESPLTGVVGRIYVDIGANVTPQTPIALVTDMGGMEMHLDIPETYLPRLALGQKAIIKVDAYPQDEFIGKVTQISPVVDVETRSAPIEITITDEKHLLQSGMFAKIRLILEERAGAPVILKEAMLGKAPNVYVYGVEGDKAVIRNIVAGIHDGPYYEVVDGLKEGDMVVIMGQQRLHDGVRVHIEQEEEIKTK